MSAAATIPFTASPTTQAAAARPWTPSDRDRLVFQWVKFDGHKQSWVATQLRIHQSTVSRMVERYERWIAHGGPAQQGAPTTAERLRTQRWLAYERNEWILTSALRIAGEMERALDTTQSTVLHPRHDPSQQSKVRTEYKVIDRSGLAARFLRLAYRINMDQLKLVEQDPLPALEPLSIADLADDLPLPLGEAGATRSVVDEGLETDSSDDIAGCYMYPADAGCPEPPAPADRASAACPSVPPSSAPSGSAHPIKSTAPAPPPDSLLDDQSLSDDQIVTSIELSPDAPPLHRTHKAAPSKPTLTAHHKTTSAKSGPRKKSRAYAYAGPSSPPDPTSPREPTTIAAAPENTITKCARERVS